MNPYLTLSTHSGHKILTALKYNVQRATYHITPNHPRCPRDEKNGPLLPGHGTHALYLAFMPDIPVRWYQPCIDAECIELYAPVMCDVRIAPHNR